MAQGHPSGAHETVLACGVALDVAQAVQAENHPVHHAWEVHSNPDEDHATEVPGTFAVYVASDLAHPVHQVWDHSSLVAHSIDLDFGIAVDLAVAVRFLDALADPGAAAVLPVPVGLPCASVLAWGDCEVVSFQVAYWDPFPYVVDHLARSVLLALPDHPWDLPVDIPYPCPCSVHPVASVAR